MMGKTLIEALAKIANLQAEVDRLRGCEPIDCLIESEVRVEELEAEVKSLKEFIAEMNDMEAYRDKKEMKRLRTEDRIECANCHVKVLRSTEWWCPACQFSRRELQVEVTAWHEYAMSTGCSHHDIVWYDSEGNAIIGGE